MTEQGAYCVAGRQQIFLLILKAGLIDPSSLELSCTLLVGWFPGDPTLVCWECTCRCKVVYYTEFPGGSNQRNVWLYHTRPLTGLCRIIEQWPSVCWSGSWRIQEAGLPSDPNLILQTWKFPESFLCESIVRDQRSYSLITRDNGSCDKAFLKMNANILPFSDFIQDTNLLEGSI